jgi:hypothetical protein
MKRKTNEQKIKQLLKECDTVEVAIIASMLGQYSSEIIENEEETRQLYENHFISPELIISTANKINNILNK